MADLSIVFGTIGASQMISDLTRLEGKALNLGNVFGSVAKSITSPAGIAAIGTVIKDMAVESVKAFADFETAYQSLSAITGATGKDLDFFKNQAKQMGETTTTSATEAVKAFELIGSAMPQLLKDSEALVQMTKDVQLLADASGMALPDATQAATSALNQYGAAASEAGRFVNVLAAGALEGSSSILQSTQALERFGSIAAGANVSIEESIGLVQQLATKSLFGAEAGTALRTILLKLSNAQILPPNAQADMKRLGINTKLVADANVPLAERLREVGKAFNDTGALTHIFEEANVNAAKTILGNIDGYTTLTGKITGTGVAAVQAAANTSTMAAQWKKIQNQIEIAMIGIGESLKPVIDDVLKGFKPAFESVMGLLKVWLTPIKDVILSVVNLGKAFGIVSEGSSNFEGIVKMLTGALKIVLLPTRLLATVLSKIIGFVADAVTGFQSFSDKMPILGSAIKILLGPIGMLGDAIGMVTSLFGESEKKAKDTTIAYNGLVRELASVATSMGATGAQTKAFTQSFDVATIAGMSKADAIKEVNRQFQAYLQTANVVPQATAAVTEAVTQSTNAFKYAAGSIGHYEELLSGLQEKFKATTSDLERIKLGGQISDLQFKLQGFGATVDYLKPQLQEMGALVKDAGELPMRNYADSFDAVAAAIDPVNEKLSMTGQIIKLVGEDAFTELQSGIGNIKDAMMDFAVTSAFAFGEAINGGKNLGQVMSQLLVGLGSTIAKLAGMALLNASVALGPTPAALAMAIAGIGLIGLSGILSSVGKKDAARFDRGDNPQASTTAAIPQQSSRGLDGATGNERQPYIIQIDGPNGEILSGYMRRQMRKDDIRRG